MKSFSLARAGRSRAGAQRGATLIIGLIMIVLITLIVVNAFTLSSSNLKSVGNMQMREEAMAAANAGIETMISAPFTNSIGTLTYTVDVNNDGTNDYTVIVAPATCIRAVQATAAAASDVELIGMSSGAYWNTDWDILATVTDAASGTSVKVHEGVRVRLSQAQKDLVCS